MHFFVLFLFGINFKWLWLVNVFFYHVCNSSVYTQTYTHTHTHTETPFLHTNTYTTKRNEVICKSSKNLPVPHTVPPHQLEVPCIRFLLYNFFLLLYSQFRMTRVTMETHSHIQIMFNHNHHRQHRDQGWCSGLKDGFPRYVSPSSNFFGSLPLFYL